mmetsp:Transcript_37950/g.69311  ORF Transcript_37950/g.69311 Transcript_37950/m.69311 type:complete len:207 (+) Transcript_37950:452-1072(+)
MQKRALVRQISEPAFGAWLQWPDQTSGSPTASLLPARRRKQQQQQLGLVGGIQCRASGQQDLLSRGLQTEDRLDLSAPGPCSGPTISDFLNAASSMDEPCFWLVLCASHLYRWLDVGRPPSLQASYRQSRRRSVPHCRAPCLWGRAGECNCELLVRRDERCWTHHLWSHHHWKIPRTHQLGLAVLICIHPLQNQPPPHSRTHLHNR